MLILYDNDILRVLIGSWAVWISDYSEVRNFDLHGDIVVFRKKAI